MVRDEQDPEPIQFLGNLGHQIDAAQQCFHDVDEYLEPYLRGFQKMYSLERIYLNQSLFAKKG